MNRFCCKLAQVVHGERVLNINFGNQEVKGQGHKSPKLDLEGWRRHHSRPASFSTNWVERVDFCSAIWPLVANETY